MAVLSTGFGYVLGRPRMQRAFAQVVPAFGAFGLCFGAWYALGALARRALHLLTAVCRPRRLAADATAANSRTRRSSRASRARDEAALAELYDRFGRVAYGLALRILRDPALAEDAVQDAFLAVWRTAAAFDPRRGKARRGC